MCAYWPVHESVPFICLCVVVFYHFKGILPIFLPHRKAVKATLVLLPLLGITYILFFVNPGEDDISQIVFIYFNSFLQSFQVRRGRVMTGEGWGHGETVQLIESESFHHEHVLLLLFHYFFGRELSAQKWGHRMMRMMMMMMLVYCFNTNTDTHTHTHTDQLPASGLPVAHA